MDCGGRLIVSRDREGGYQRTLQQYRDYPMPVRPAEDDECLFWA